MSVGKRALELLLARAGPAAWALRRRRGRTVILAYHNVVPDGTTVSGETSLHLGRSDFARQLDVLRRTHAVVPLRECLDGAAAPDRPQAVVTFDDAYRGALIHGLDEVVARGMPATVFVAPGLLGGRRTWWDRAAGARGGRLEPALRERALEEFGGDGAAVLEWLGERDGSSRSATQRVTTPGAPSPACVTATEEELGAAAEREGVTVAAHGWSHRTLTRLDEDELTTELERTLTWLRDRFQAVTPWLSYPYGRSSQRVERAAGDAGYEGAVRVSGGWLPESCEEIRYALPRVHIPAGVSIDGFRLRASGLIER